MGKEKVAGSSAIDVVENSDSITEQSGSEFEA